MGKTGVAALIAAIAFTAAGGCSAWAEDFYHGRTITIYVGFSPGGGFDINARLLARYLGQYIPGRPDVVVANMPGAASLTSVQYLDTIAPKDGTTIGTFNFGLIGDSKIYPERVKADFRNFAWIGSVSDDVTVCYTWGALGIKTLEQARQRPQLHMGDVGPGTSDFMNQNILKNIFGVKIREVMGYPGSAEQRIAIERGELDGDCGAWASLPADWIENHKINPLTRSAADILPGLPPDVPYVADIAPDEHAKTIIRLLTAPGLVGRPFIASKSVPPDRLRQLREAFNAAVKDPKFLAEAEKLRLPVSPKTADDSLVAIREIYDAPPDIVKGARAATGGD